YFACLLESVLCGSTDPEKIGRPSVARIMRKSPGLQKRIEASKIEVNGQTAFNAEMERVSNVMLKLARGHAAFELSQPCRENPDHFWCGPLLSLTQEGRALFDSVHFQQTFGEVGSRNMQRLIVTQMAIQDENGEQRNVEMLINDWVDVQDNQYRYLAIDDMGSIMIRIVISEYFACEVAWSV
ncbi:MAG: hypothetical protein ACT6QS_07135, partial [Flavobacteriales bacterium]